MSVTHTHSLTEAVDLISHYIHACIYTCMCIIHACTYMNVHACTYTLACIYMHTHMHMSACIHTMHTFIHMPVHIHMHKHTHTHLVCPLFLEGCERRVLRYPLHESCQKELSLDFLAGFPGTTSWDWVLSNLLFLGRLLISWLVWKICLAIISCDVLITFSLPEDWMLELMHHYFTFCNSST